MPLYLKSEPQKQEQLMSNQGRDGRGDFDFFFGSWIGHNRRLRERLKGSTSWEEFEGHSVVRKILDGMGNMDEVTFNRESGQSKGYTLRLYDPQYQQWRIYWASTTQLILDVPMVGKFETGAASFIPRNILRARRYSAALSGKSIPRTLATGSRP